MTDTPSPTGDVRPPDPEPSPPAADADLAPAEVAGSQVLVSEPGGGDPVVDEDDGPAMLDVRGHKFKLRDAVPGLTLSRVSRVGVRASRVSETAPKREDGTVDQEALSPSQHRVLQEASGLPFDLFKGLVSPDEFDEFVDFVEDQEPPVEAAELATLLADAMEAITGRPTSRRRS